MIGAWLKENTITGTASAARYLAPGVEAGGGQAVLQEVGGIQLGIGYSEMPIRNLQRQEHQHFPYRHDAVFASQQLPD